MELWTWLGILVALLSLLFFAAVVYIHWIHQKYAHIPAPRRKSFFLGHLPQVRDAEAKGSFLIDQITQWMLQYGNTICIFILHHPTVFTVDPQLVKEVLIQGNGHPKSPALCNAVKVLFGKRFLGSNLSTNLDDQSWTERRRQIEVAFKRETLKSYLDQVNLSADDMMNNLRSVADGKTHVTMLEEFSATALNIFGKVGCDKEINCGNSTGDAIHQALSQVTIGLDTVLYKGTLSQYFPSNWDLVHKTREAIALLRHTAWEWASECKAALDAGQYVKEDILKNIIKAAGKDFHGKKEITIDDLLGFMIGGQETTGSTMAFAVMELGRHPEVLAKLRSEVDEVVGERSYVTQEDLGRLSYLSQVIKETLRLYATATFTARRLKHQLVVNNLVIPEGTDVSEVKTLITRHLRGQTLPPSTQVIFRAMGRMPQFYPDPHQFDPERFGPEAPNRPYTYAPFSLGPRNCIGQNFAKMEMKVVLVKFLQHFSYILDPNQSFGEVHSTTLKPQSGVKVTLTLRDQQTQRM